MHVELTTCLLYTKSNKVKKKKKSETLRREVYQSETHVVEELSHFESDIPEFAYQLYDLG